MTPSFDESIESRLSSSDWSKDMSQNILGTHRHQVKMKRIRASVLSLCVITMVGFLFSGQFNAKTDPFLLESSVSSYYSSVVEESDNLLAFDTIYF